MHLTDTSGSGALRHRFDDASLETIAPHRVVVMCFDRLLRDCDSALAAIATADHEVANSSLRHAQDLIGELVAMLDVDAWEHSGSLLSVYDYVLRRLAHANTFKDAAGVAEARHLLAELGDGFRRAAAELADDTAGARRPDVPGAGAAPSPAPAPAAPSHGHPVPGHGIGGDAGPPRPRLSVRA